MDTHIFFICLLVGGHLGCFYFLAIGGCEHVYKFLCDFVGIYITLRIYCTVKCWVI